MAPNTFKRRDVRERRKRNSNIFHDAMGVSNNLSNVLHSDGTMSNLILEAASLAQQFNQQFFQLIPTATNIISQGEGLQLQQIFSEPSNPSNDESPLFVIPDIDSNMLMSQLGSEESSVSVPLSGETSTTTADVLTVNDSATTLPNSVPSSGETSAADNVAPVNDSALPNLSTVFSHEIPTSASIAFYGTLLNGITVFSEIVAASDAIDPLSTISVNQSDILANYHSFHQATVPSIESHSDCPICSGLFSPVGYSPYSLSEPSSDSELENSDFEYEP